MNVQIQLKQEHVWKRFTWSKDIPEIDSFVHAHTWHTVYAFICVTCLIYMCDMTQSYAWHDSSMCETFLMYMCDMTQAWHPVRVVPLLGMFMQNNLCCQMFLVGEHLLTSYNSIWISCETRDSKPIPNDLPFLCATNDFTLLLTKITGGTSLFFFYSPTHNADTHIQTHRHADTQTHRHINTQTHSTHTHTYSYQVSSVASSGSSKGLK